MAVDEFLLEEAGRSRSCSLRFYQWAEPTLSLGYFQSYAERDQHAASSRCAVVRRSTGGGAILHDRELTYSLTVGGQNRLAASAISLYRLVHVALARSLAAAGIAARLSGSPASVGISSEPFLCFQRRSDGDLIAGEVKICGSAQRRRRGGILQHGSVLLARSSAAPELAGVAELCRTALTTDQLIELWLPELAQALNVTWQPDELSGTELEAISRIVIKKHANRDWIERR